MVELVNAVMYELLFLISMVLGYSFFGKIQFKNSKVIWLLVAVGLILSTVMLKIQFRALDDDVIALFILWLAVFAIEKHSIKRVLSLYVFLFISILLLNLVVIYCARYMYFLHLFPQIIKSTYSWFAEIIVIGILAIFLYLRKKNMGKLGISLSKKQYLILYVVVLISMTMASGMNYYVSIIHEQKEAALIGMITATASVVLIILAVYQVILAQNYQLLKENFRLQKQFHTMQEIYFENIAEQSNKTKRFRHDIKAHLQSIWQLALNNNDKEIIEYIDKIQQYAHFDKKYYFTGNQIIDILLSEIVQQAQEKQIKVNINGIMPNDLNLDLVDLTSICYNLLQNALEATIRENDSEFSVNFAVKNQQFVFVVKNRISEKMRIDEGKLKSRKKDIKNHGLGLKNVYDAVERSKGVFDINIQNQQFVARVVLPCE